ncbi:MAG: putative AlkP superfamily phosphohydrolase/phosphomutase [Hyphomicrobiaceae bacterium]
MPALTSEGSEHRRRCSNPSMPRRPKVLVIGLDGVPFTLLRDWANAGELPTFSKLLADGAAGGLASTMPPTSGPSWSSFVTGKNPGKTGIYDFLYRRPGSYVFPPVNATMRSGPSLWALAGDAGLRTCAINLPIAYPVEEVNGALVSGWMTPYFATDYTWPPELGREIEDAVGDYRIYPSETFAPSRSTAFFGACDELLELLTKTSHYLLDREDWDLFMTVYFDTDRVLHQLWHYIDPKHPWRSDDGQDLSAPVKRYFNRLDSDVAGLIEKAGDDATVVVMSDHGMGRASRFIVLNNLLMELGFLELNHDRATRAKAAAFRRGFTLRNVHRFVDWLGFAKHAEYKNVYSFDGLLKRFFLSFHNVDWANTQAYSFGRHYGSVFLNVRGREPQGSIEPGAEYERVRDEIAGAVLAWKDPRLGRPLVGKVLKREEVYKGDRFEEAPDLILLPQDPADIFYGLSDFGSNRIWDETYRYSGMHRDEGLLFLNGKGVRAGVPTDGAAIVDLAPTILWLLGASVPTDMDGRVLTELFEDEFVATHPVAYADGGTPDGNSPHSREYNEAEEAEVMERLRDLGYLN